MAEIIFTDNQEILFITELVYKDIPPKRGISKISLTCGMPSVVNLFEQYADWGKQVPLDIRSQTDRYDFWLVRFFFTLQISRGYRVDFFEIGVLLSHPTRIPLTAKIVSNRVTQGTTVTAPPVNDPPLAHDLFPLQVADQVEVQQTLGISPSLEFMQAKVAVGNAGLTLKHTENLPRITAFNKRQPDPCWRFEPGSTRQRHVEPGIRELMMIVRACKDKPVCAVIRVDGRCHGYILATKISPPSQNEFYF